ncbi:hypothetical protein LCGC14_0258270 [marine sediment metagenome]|uniref:Uncharacterized protein n=1 Tax=marine sediment metagenome TaxID=412755 RepID=A0A0F9UJ53_9ZZZZ
MKHYVILHRQSASNTTVIGVFHEPSEPISLVRVAAVAECTNPECYEEKVAAGKEVFRATYGIEGECFLVEKIPSRLYVPFEGATAPAPKSPAKLRVWLSEALEGLLGKDWELVDAMTERDHIVREAEGSPFLGKFPGPNLFFSLHLRMTEAARALLNVTDDDRARVRASLKDQG